MSENHDILKLEKDFNLLFPWFHLQMKKLKPRLEKEPTHGHTTYNQTETSSAVFATELWESLLQKEKEGTSSSSSRPNRLEMRCVTILLTIKCTGFLSNTYHQCALMATTQVHRHHCSGETDCRLSSATHKLCELRQSSGYRQEYQSEDEQWGSLHKSSSLFSTCPAPLAHSPWRTLVSPSHSSSGMYSRNKETDPHCGTGMSRRKNICKVSITWLVFTEWQVFLL